MFNHFFHLEMNRVLDAFSTESEVFQRFEREPPLGRPVVTMGGNDSSGNVVRKPVFEDKRLIGVFDILISHMDYQYINIFLKY